MNFRQMRLPGEEDSLCGAKCFFHRIFELWRTSVPR